MQSSFNLISIEDLIAQGYLAKSHMSILGQLFAGQNTINEIEARLHILQNVGSDISQALLSSYDKNREFSEKKLPELLEVSVGLYPKFQTLFKQPKYEESKIGLVDLYSKFVDAFYTPYFEIQREFKKNKNSFFDSAEQLDTIIKCTFQIMIERKCPLSEWFPSIHFQKPFSSFPKKKVLQQEFQGYDAEQLGMQIESIVGLLKQYNFNQHEINYIKTILKLFSEFKQMVPQFQEADETFNKHVEEVLGKNLGSILVMIFKIGQNFFQYAIKNQKSHPLTEENEYLDFAYRLFEAVKENNKFGIVDEKLAAIVEKNRVEFIEWATAYEKISNTPEYRV